MHAQKGAEAGFVVKQAELAAPLHWMVGQKEGEKRHEDISLPNPPLNRATNQLAKLPR